MASGSDPALPHKTPSKAATIVSGFLITEIQALMSAKRMQHGWEKVRCGVIKNR
jgi:hypothetical protein